MARRTRAGHVKTALHEITRELVSKNQYMSSSAIAELRSRNKKIIERDIEDIVDFGLRAIAGLVRSRPVATPNEEDLSQKWGVREFETFVFKLDDGKFEPRVVNVLDTTLEFYDSRITRAKKPRAETNSRNSSARYFEEMRDKGLTKLPLREYLLRRKNGD